ncbi:MAG: hypothetical protein UT23_C0010G0038 [Candidatus Woesebacteria bacterium GW2011_GWA1_39_12]|uniref:Uncharacterized protein n=1 Tax=Candidatus Woesebacteria bacterium GW2011_GWA1_39_12 TaxID=1618549 RepID=A0A0G0M2Y8_9BACT|nr:MAG: hypothetical protein UT23_C0010G0038 [Candidatus Woesebacteria bacterium GW2011_GWA1_39_12]
MYDQILNKLRTLEDKEKLLLEIEILLSGLYEVYMRKKDLVLIHFYKTG